MATHWFFLRDEGLKRDKGRGTRNEGLKRDKGQGTEKGQGTRDKGRGTEKGQGTRDEGRGTILTKFYYYVSSYRGSRANS